MNDEYTLMMTKFPLLDGFTEAGAQMLMRAAERSVVLQWSASAFRVVLLRHELLSERVLMNALSVLVERERSLVATLLEAQGGR